MEIRILNLSDAESYREIRLEALQNNAEAFASSYEEERDYPIEVYRKRLQSEDAFTFGAFENEELIGTVTLVKEKKMKMKHRADIVAMYVDREKRGLGAGRSLLQAAIRKAKELEDVEKVQLCVVTTNETAKRLYASLGFEVYGTEKNALKLDHHYFDEEHRVLFL